MTSLNKAIQLAIDLLKKYKPDGYEILLESNSGISTAVRLNKIESLQHHLNKNFSISIYIGQKKGCASSVDLSKYGISKTIESAYTIAKYTQQDPFNSIAPKKLMAFNPPKLNLYHPWDITATASINLAQKCEAIALQQKEINNSEGVEVSSIKHNMIYANSNELIASAKSTMHSICCKLIAKRHNDMQTAYEYTIALDYKDLDSPSSIGIKAANLATAKLGARSIIAQKCPIIFTPQLSSSLFMQLLGALSGTRQYKKSTFLLNSIGTTVLPKYISLLEDPFAKKTMGAKAFDSDGVLKRKQYFIKDGRVTSYVLSQYSAKQLGLKTTANAGGVNNVIVSHNFDGNMYKMAKNVNKGLLVTELMGHGVNSTTGDYSRGAFGFWIENGTLQYPVSGVTIAGNLKDMLLGITHIGNDVDYRNNIKVGSVLIDNMTIAG